MAAKHNQHRVANRVTALGLSLMLSAFSSLVDMSLVYAAGMGNDFSI